MNSKITLELSEIKSENRSYPSYKKKLRFFNRKIFALLLISSGLIILWDYSIYYLSILSLTVCLRWFLVKFFPYLNNAAAFDPQDPFLKEMDDELW